MIKIWRFLVVCTILSLLNGCTPVGKLIQNDSGLALKKSKEGYVISGKTTTSAVGSVMYVWPIRLNRNKSASITCKLLVRKGFSDSNNITIGFISDKGYTYTFGPRNRAYYAINDQKQIYDTKNVKPLFGDESQKYHEIVVNYEGKDKIFRGYVDGILFGEIDSKQIESQNDNYLTNIFFGYNTLGKDIEVDVVFKDFKIKK